MYSVSYIESVASNSKLFLSNFFWRLTLIQGADPELYFVWKTQYNIYLVMEIQTCEVEVVTVETRSVFGSKGHRLYRKRAGPGLKFIKRELWTPKFIYTVKMLNPNITLQYSGSCIYSVSYPVNYVFSVHYTIFPLFLLILNQILVFFFFCFFEKIKIYSEIKNTKLKTKI